MNHLENLDRSKNAEVAAARLAETIATLHADQAMYVQNAPEKMQRVFADSFAGTSRASAIKAKCLACCNFQRDEVAACSVMTCPLYAVRPYQTNDDQPE